MRLYVISDYRCREIVYQKGQELDVDPATATFLMLDAPGCFSLKAPSDPDKDKMIRPQKVVKK